MAGCPPAESLERLLGEELTDPERKRIEAQSGRRVFPT
jgi:hypothetical protein